MALSRTSRIALLCWAVGHMILALAMLRGSFMSHLPFAKAHDAWWKAYAAGDYEGQRVSIEAEKSALCASWFSSDRECPKR